MKLQFLGATDTVTGSKYLLRHGNAQVLVDCGLFQGYKQLRDRNRAVFPVPPETIDTVLLTHAHLDHAYAAGVFAGDDVPVFVHEDDAAELVDPAHLHPLVQLAAGRDHGVGERVSLGDIGADVVSLVGRDPAAIRSECAPGRRLLVLSSDETTPAVVAEHVLAVGYGQLPWIALVLAFAIAARLPRCDDATIGLR